MGHIFFDRNHTIMRKNIVHKKRSQGKYDYFPSCGQKIALCRSVLEVNVEIGTLCMLQCFDFKVTWRRFHG